MGIFRYIKNIKIELFSFTNEHIYPHDMTKKNSLQQRRQRDIGRCAGCRVQRIQATTTTV